MARILVVDGDDRYRSVCVGTLEREGHEVLTATTGVEALRITDEQLPDMVITEIQLPGMDGLDLMARLLARHRRILVILNSKSSSYKDNFMSWAADAYLTKSVDSGELSAKVRELLTGQAAITTQAVESPAGSMARRVGMTHAPAPPIQAWLHGEPKAPMVRPQRPKF